MNFDTFYSDIDAVIFDMDGVLLDSETITIECWHRAAQELGISRADIDEANAACMGRNIADTVSYLDSRYGGRIAHFDGYTFRRRCSALFAEIADGKALPLMPYARECLEYLSHTRLCLALASSTNEAAVRSELAQVDLLHYFECITTGDMVLHSKPAPDIYLKAAASLGVESRRCIAVEDSPNGALSAIEAGMKCVVIPDKLPPTEEIKSRCYRIFPSLESLITVL